MLTKQEVLNILTLALANPNYLGIAEQTSFGCFCPSVRSVVETVYNKQHVEWVDSVVRLVCDTYVYPSINEELFLRSYLIQTGKIPESTSYCDAEYRVAAHGHWQTVIDKLKSSIEDESK